MTQIDIHNIEEWLTIARHAGYRVEVLCKELNVCQRQVQRYTQEAFGRSPYAWLDEQRLLSAADMLKNHRPIKSVSFEHGFKQISHFSRKFKKHFGISPRAYVAWVDAQEGTTTPAERRAPRHNQAICRGADQMSGGDKQISANV